MSKIQTEKRMVKARNAMTLRIHTSKVDFRPSTPGEYKSLKSGNAFNNPNKIIRFDNTK